MFRFTRLPLLTASPEVWIASTGRGGRRAGRRDGRFLHMACPEPIEPARVIQRQVQHPAFRVLLLDDFASDLGREGTATNGLHDRLTFTSVYVATSGPVASSPVCNALVSTAGDSRLQGNAPDYLNRAIGASRRSARQQRPLGTVQMVLDTAEGVVHVAQLDSKPCDDGHRSRSSPARDGDGQGYGLQVGAPPPR